MKRIQRVELLAKLAKTKSDVMAKLFYDSVKQYNQEEQRLSELQNYKACYEAEMKGLVGAKAHPSTLQVYHNFLEHLDMVIQEQVKVKESTQAEMQRRKAVWVNYYQKNKMIHNYADKMRVDFERALDYKEQKALDAMVTDRYAAKIKD